LAGDVACESTGEQALVATDLINALPEAMRRVRADAGEKWVKVRTFVHQRSMNPGSGLR
jgi:hypothetical protein